MLRVEVVNVFLSSKGFVVMLKSKDDARSLPIFVGAQEAQAIAMALDDIQMPRPLTHNLFKSVLDELNCTLLQVDITDIVDNTFYGTLALDYHGAPLEIDSRPSDAIALALRFDAPIYVDSKVIEEAGVIIDLEESADKHEMNIPESEFLPSGGQTDTPANDPIQKLSPIDSLKSELTKAIAQERYEDAARLRDELKTMSTGN